MRTLNRNKQEMYYSLLGAEQEIYVLDDDGNKILDYVDGDGIEYYRTEKVVLYTPPVKFYGNIAMSGGEARMVEYGLNQEQYEAKIILPINSVPLTETSRIWHKNEPKTTLMEYWFVGSDEKSYIEVPDEFSADYSIIKISPSLNFTTYVLKKIVK